MQRRRRAQPPLRAAPFATTPLRRYSEDFHTAVCALVRARKQGEEGCEDVAGPEASKLVRAAVEERAPTASPFLWVDPEDPKAPFRWLDPVAGPARACFLLLREREREHHRIATAANLAVCLETALRRQLEAEQRGHTAAPYVAARLVAAAREALVGVFQEEETKAALRAAVEPLWDEALTLLPKFRREGKLYVTTNYRSRHDALLARHLLRREHFFVLPPLPPLQGTIEQLAAVDAILAQLRGAGWSVMSGCGGAGKTYLLGQIARALAEASVPNERREDARCPLCSRVTIGSRCTCGCQLQLGPLRPVHLAFAAPTNRAVAVLQKALSGGGSGGGGGGSGALTTVATLHSLALLRLTAPVDLLVVDESSMLDAEHGDLLVGCSALRRAAVLFVGDDAQLAPVGRGELLRPLLELCGAPRLLANLRAEGAELRAALGAIRAGDARSAAAFAAPPQEDVQSLLPSVLEAARAGPLAAQVLALRNEERVAYCGLAARTLRRRRDARDEYAEGAPAPRIFVPFEGEPVRFQTNRHKPAACKGALGAVRRCEERPDGAWCVEVVLPDAAAVELRAASLAALAFELRPAFAITVHDAQGGEFDAVHVLLPPRTDSPLCSLEMLYTAASRARRALTIWPHSADFAAYEARLAQRSPARITPLAAALRP
jgi:exodeoxyribonuclease V alpha subunit